MVLLNVVGAALAMPGDIEEEGFCIDGDVVAGFCLGPDYSEFVQGPPWSDIYPSVSPSPNDPVFFTFL